nr:hypothetical protein [Tanacetum cinerariifolium]
MDLGMHVMSADFQENTSKLSFSRLQSSIIPFSDRLPPIIMICSGYSGWIALIPSTAVCSLGGDPFGGSATNLHSDGIMVLPRSVTIPPSTGNLSIPCAVDGTNWIFLRPGWPMILLYEEGHLTTIKFIKALVECSSSPRIPADLPSTYIRWTRWPLTFASITIGLSCPSSFARGGNEISGFVEKL